RWISCTRTRCAAAKGNGRRSMPIPANACGRSAMRNDGPRCAQHTHEDGGEMSFKQYLRDEVTVHLDETYKVDEAWAKNHPGRAYFDVHLSTIRDHEMATPTFRQYLSGGKLRILESGCGTGRWMAFFEQLGNHAYGVDDSWGPLRL